MEPPAGLCCEPLEHDQTLPQFLGRGRDRQPAIAVPDDPPQRSVGQAADQDRRMRPLQGSRGGEDGIERVGLAAIGDLATGADRLEDLEVFVRDPAALLEVVAVEDVELFFQPADAGAQHDAAAREVIERHQHARQQHGVAIGHDQRGRADAHALGRADEHAHGGDGLHERIGEA